MQGMRLRDFPERAQHATPVLSIRIPAESMTFLIQLRQRFGCRAVNAVLKEAIMKAIEDERADLERNA